MFEKLIKIANNLDDMGLFEESNIVTSILVKLASDEEDDHDELSDHLEEDDDKDDGKKYAKSDKNKGKKLNKPFRTPGGPKKFSVYVKNDKGNIVKVNFGDPNMRIKDNIPGRRKNFRARHNCDNPGPKTKARYWSCRQWSNSKSDI